MGSSLVCTPPATAASAVQKVASTTRFDLDEASREKLLKLVRTGVARALPWETLPMRSFSLTVLYNEILQSPDRLKALPNLASLAFERALSRNVDKPCLYAEASIRFLSDFATQSDHACYLVEYGVLDFLRKLCVGWDKTTVLACTWELLLTLCTAVCPAHLERMLCSPLFEDVCVAVRKVNCVSKEAVMVTYTADDRALALSVPQTDEAIEKRRKECDEFRHNAANMIVFRCEKPKEERDCAHAAGAA